MRIHYANTTHVARVSKTLRKSLLARQIDVPLTSCQETVARMVGYADWQDLVRSVGGAELPSVPDELVPIAVQAARKRQYLSVLTDRGIPEPIAHAIVSELSPSCRRLVEIEEGDLVLNNSDTLAGLDLSPASVAKHPGLLNLLRRTHHAVVHEPYWAELSSWRVFREIDPSAVRKVSILKGNIAHPWWGPSLVAALAEDSTPKALSGPARDGDLSALSKALARLGRREFMTVVTNVTNRVGVKLLDAKPEFFELPPIWSKLPWMPYEPRPNGPFGPSAWEHVCEALMLPYGLHEHDIFEDHTVRIKASSDLEDEDVEELLCFKGPSKAEVKRFLKRPGARAVMLGLDGEGPVIGALVRREADFSAGTYSFEYLGTFLDRSSDYGIPPGELKKIFAAAIGFEIHEEIEGNGRALRPGTTVPITFVDVSKDRQNVVLPTLVLGLRGQSDIASGLGEPVLSEVVSRLDVAASFPSRTVSDQDREHLRQVARIKDYSFFLHPGSWRPLAIVATGTSIGLWHAGDIIKWGELPDKMRNDASVDVKALSEYVHMLGRDLKIGDPCLVRLTRGGTFVLDHKDFKALQAGKRLRSLPILLSEAASLEQDVHEMLFEYPTLAELES